MPFTRLLPYICIFVIFSLYPIFVSSYFSLFNSPPSCYFFSFKVIFIQVFTLFCWVFFLIVVPFFSQLTRCFHFKLSTGSFSTPASLTLFLVPMCTYGFVIFMYSYGFVILMYTYAFVILMDLEGGGIDFL